MKDALDLGEIFIDTAESYGTESIVGKALAGFVRESFILSTEAGVRASLSPDDSRSTAEQFTARMEAALTRLRTDYVDLFHLHGVNSADYLYAR